MYPKIEQLVIDQLKLLLEIVTADVARSMSEANRFREFGIIDLVMPRRSGKSTAARNLSERLKAPVIYHSYASSTAYAGYSLDAFLHSPPVPYNYPYSHIIADEPSERQLNTLIGTLIHYINIGKIDRNVKLISLRTYHV